MLVLAFIFLGACWIAEGVESHTYHAILLVDYIDHTRDCMLAEDETGFLYSFKGTDGWAEGDCVICEMNDRGTPDRHDDEIKKAERGNWPIQRPTGYIYNRVGTI